MTDQEYIKMILALDDEFFKGWEWKAGDKALSINDQYKRELLLLTTAPLEKLNSNDNVTLLFPHSVDGVTVDEYIFNLRPLPSQEQLQEIIKKQCLSHNVKLKDIEILKRVVDWHIRRDPKHTLERSAECLFLEVVQWLNDKTWNGEAWV